MEDIHWEHIHLVTLTGMSFTGGTLTRTLFTGTSFTMRIFTSFTLGTFTHVRAALSREAHFLLVTGVLHHEHLTQRFFC